MKRGLVMGLMVLLLVSVAYGVPVIKQLPFSKTTNLTPATYTFKFSLWDALTDGTNVWSEEKDVKMTSSTLKTNLGTKTSLDTVDFSQQLWVQVERNDGGVYTVIGTRTRLTLAPYAIWSETSETTGSHTHDAVDITSGTINNAYFSAYLDLTEEGYLDNNSGTDLLTRAQADNRYITDNQDNSITSAMIVDGTVSSEDVGFNYAGSTSKGGPATDLSCAGCVSQSELSFTPLSSETDPQVGAVTASKWCAGDGSAVQCSQDPPALASHNHNATYVNVAGDTMTGSLSVEGNISTNGVYRFGTSTVLSTPSSNTFLGHYTGSSNTTGNYNAFIGKYAGNANFGGSNNAFLGNYAGYKNTIGNDNTFLGYAAGYSNIDGLRNAFIGNKAGYSNTMGDNNTFIGRLSGYSNTTGSYNTFVGGDAGYSNTDASSDSNTFIGYSAGYKNTTGKDNTFVGRDAGYSNNIGELLTFVGKDAGYSNTTGYSNTFIGNVAGYKNTTGYSNTFIGRAAGYLNTDGFSNTFIGRFAGYSNTTGDDNAFLGTMAGYSNNTGSYNTFVGRDAGHSNDVGVYNTFIGRYAGFSSPDSSYNTFIGGEAGYSNLAGDANTFVGSYAGYYNTEGQFNTYIGYMAGWGGRGSRNVSIGMQAGHFETGNDKLYIANSTTSSPLIYGNFATNELTINGKFSATGTKNFIQPHAKDPSKEIVYVAAEAPEAVVMYRGTGELKDGMAVIELPEYFSVVAAEEGLQVQVTPTEDCNGIFVKSKSKERIEIKELMNGRGKAKFDYLITAVRAGYQDHKPVVANTSFRPKENETAHAFAERYKGDDTNTKAIRAMLISNGILTEEGELNMKLVKKLGWTVKETELAKVQE